MAPPATVSDPPFSVAPSSKIHYPDHHNHNHTNNNNSSRSSEEERESIDGGAVDERGITPSGKRPRGRPPGSKNKPKVPTYLSVDPQDALRSHVMEVASGADISSSLSAYARSRGRGVAVLHAVGSVAGVTFRQQNHDSPLFLKGNLDLISLSGTVLPDNTMLGPSGLTVFVSGPHGQVMGGPVEGRLVAAGIVMVMAATFSTATYEKLPLQAELGQAAMEDPRSSGYHPGLHMENGSSSVAAGGGAPPENPSYGWVHQHHHQNSTDNNNRPPYM